MTRRLRYSTEALKSLADISEHVFHERGERAAERIAAALDEKCRTLAGLPGTLGRARPELRFDLRSFAFGNFVIFFRYVEDTLDIVDIVDGRRDLDHYFSGE